MKQENIVVGKSVGKNPGMPLSLSGNDAVLFFAKGSIQTDNGHGCYGAPGSTFGDPTTVSQKL